MQFNILTALWLVLVISAIYGRVANFDLSGTDDTSLISNRSDFITKLSSIPTAFKQPFFPGRRQTEGFYRPLVTTSLILDAQRSRTDPKQFHITNIFLHITACILLYFFLLQLGFRQTSCLAAATLFAVHPINTEAVCWIPGRIDVMLTIFCLASFMTFLLYRDRKTYWSLGLHLLFFTAALFTKEAAITLPVICLSYIFLMKERYAKIIDLKLFGGWALILIIWLIAWNSIVTGASSELKVWILNTIKNSLVLFMQLGKICIPRNLSVLAFPANTQWLPGLVAAILLVLSAFLIRQKRKSLCIFLFGIAWFFFLAAITLPVAAYQILENRLYMPTVGIAVALIALAEHLLNKYPRPRTQIVLSVFVAVLVCAFTAQSFLYSASFRDVNSFTENAITTSPDNPLACLNRGVYLHRTGNLLEAARNYKRAIELNPDQPNIANNLGTIRMARKEYAQAEQLFRHEIKINPTSYTAFFNLGRALKMQGSEDEAVRMIQQALKINSGETKQYIQERIQYNQTKGSQRIADWMRQFLTQ